MELTDIRMGDVVRLTDGKTLTVDSVITSYTDATGQHDGPFVADRNHARHLLTEVAEIVKRNERLCSICGSGITSTDPTVDFCRNCHYSGSALERMLRTEKRDVLTRIGALDNVTDATVWHTGGGCFNLAVTLEDGRLLTPSVGYMENGGVWPEPGIPDPDEDGKWCLVISENADAWGEWDEDKLAIVERLYTDDELVVAIATVAAREGIGVEGL